MAREKNIVESVQITLSTTSRVRDYLEELALMGLYGKNVAEAAERLVSDMINQKINSGELDRMPRLEKPDQTA